MQIKTKHILLGRLFKTLLYIAIIVLWMGNVYVLASQLPTIYQKPIEILELTKYQQGLDEIINSSEVIDTLAKYLKTKNLDGRIIEQFTNNKSQYITHLRLQYTFLQNQTDQNGYKILLEKLQKITSWDGKLKSLEGSLSIDNESRAKKKTKLVIIFDEILSNIDYMHNHVQPNSQSKLDLCSILNINPTIKFAAEYKIVSPLNLQQLKQLLQRNFIKENKLIYVICPFATMAIFRIGDIYHYIDQNRYDHNILKFNLDDLADIIFKSYNAFNEAELVFGFLVFSIDTNKAVDLSAYPKQKMFLDTIFVNYEHKPYQLKEAILMASDIDCQESHDFFTNALSAIDAKATIFPETNFDKKILIDAAKKGNINTLKSAVDNTNIDTQDDFGRTLLMLAVKNNHFNTTKFLLQSGADAHIKDNEDKNALTYAIDNENLAIIDILIVEAPGIVWHINHGWSVLMHAAKKNNPMLIKSLLAKMVANPREQAMLVEFFMATVNRDVLLVKNNIKNVFLQNNSRYCEIALLLAVTSGCIEIVKAILNESRAIDARCGWNPLMHAAINKYKKLVKFFLERAGFDKLNQDIWIDIIISSANKDYVMVEYLLNKIDLSKQKSYTIIALQAALLNNDVKMAKIFFTKDLVNELDYNGDTLLMYAAIGGCNEMVPILLQSGAEIDKRTYQGMTALMFAAQYGSTAVAVSLLNENANIDATCNSGRTALMFAIQRENRDVAKILINRGAQINQQETTVRANALILAIGNKNEAMLDILLSKNADIHQINHKGLDACMYAVQAGYYTMVEKLLFNGAKVNTVRKDGLTTLDCAIVYNHEKIAQLLMDNKGISNLKRKDKNGWSLLMTHASKGDVWMARDLLRCGAIIDDVNNDGLTALMLAVQNKRYQVVELLIGNHANLNLKNNANQNALDIAMQNKDIEMVRLLKPK